MNFKQKILPHVIAVLVFAIVTAIYFFPVAFENKVLYQNDILQGQGAASEVIDYKEKTGEEVLWTNTMFSGMPAYFSGMTWSGQRFLKTVQHIYTLYLPGTLAVCFMAFISFYILLIVFGVRPVLSIAGALAFGLSTFYMISIGAGHMWKVRAIAYIPLVLAGIELVFKGNRKWGFILFALALGLEINANHLQITYYLLIMVSIYGIVQLAYAIKNKSIATLGRNVAVLMAGALLAIMVNFGRIWTSIEYSTYSNRGKSELTQTGDKVSNGLDPGYAFRWSSGKWESMTFLVPNLYGGGSGRYSGSDSELSKALRRNNVPANQISQYEAGTLGYWGDQPSTAGPVYIGAIICFLFIASFFFIDKKIMLWILPITVLSIILSWGSNFPSFNYLMFDNFPGYNKFRAVTMIVTMAMTVIPLMSFLSLEKLLQSGWTPIVKKNLLISLGIVGGIALLIGLFPNPPQLTGEQIPDWFSEAVRKDRISIVRMDAFRSIFFILVSFLVIIFSLRKRLSYLAMGIILSIMIVIDLGLVDSRYLNHGDFHRKTENNFTDKTEADKVILEDPDKNFRVLNLQNPFVEARTSLFHKSIGGYHGAKIKRYQDLIERHIDPEIRNIMTNKGLNPSQMPVINMLNTKYVMAGTQKNGVIRNRGALGNAWFVDELKVVSSPDEEINSLSAIDPGKTAVIDESKFKLENFSKDLTGKIELIEYNPNYLVYQSDHTANGLAVFSEVYYPKGWLATIDGNPADIKRVNYILRALEIPAGNHEIRFEFTPASYVIGNNVSKAGIGIYILLFLAGIFLSVKALREPDIDFLS